MPAIPTSLDTLAILNKVPVNYLIILPNAPRFTIVGATDSYLQRTYLNRETVLGQSVFETLSDNPYNSDATGVKNLTASLLTVIKTRQEHEMADQRYDVLNPQTH